MNNEAITNNRLTYLDIAEGFGILCVIAGHMGNETKNFFYIYSICDIRGFLIRHIFIRS